MSPLARGEVPHHSLRRRRTLHDKLAKERCRGNGVPRKRSLMSEDQGKMQVGANDGRDRAV
jgi:hypothetical protein